MATAVTVAWDGKASRWLADALRSIDAQRPAASERCLVIDSVQAEAALAELAAHGIVPSEQGWTVQIGDWRDPAAARNAGLRVTTAEWVVFWDADNVMSPGFLAATEAASKTAGPNVGILYADIEYVDAHLANPQRWTLPAYDYWSLRSGNYIDTGSAWRRGAVELAGGWPEGLQSFEDWALALEVTRRGWVATKRSGPSIVLRRHSQSRSQVRERTGERRSDVWPIRSLGIVSLLAGRRAVFERWHHFLQAAELPRHCSLYVVDNSGDAAFGDLVRATVDTLVRSRGMEGGTVLTRTEQYAPQPNQGYFDRARHLHVARMYSDLLPRVTEDLVLTLEDDVEPRPDAIRRLTEQLGVTAWGNIGAMAAAYDMGDDLLCAGRPGWGWGERIRWSDVGDGPIEASCVGGGCTLWAGWALATRPISFRWQESLGWDGSLCTDLRRQGFRIQVHGGVRATHHIHGTVRD